MLPLTENQLRELAHKRVEFRTHLVVYCVINFLLWVIWYVTGSHYPWPVWPMVGWGTGVIFQYLFDYRRSRILSEEDEFQKLKKQIESGLPHTGTKEK